MKNDPKIEDLPFQKFDIEDVSFPELDFDEILNMNLDIDEISLPEPDIQEFNEMMQGIEKALSNYALFNTFT